MTGTVVIVTPAVAQPEGPYRTQNFQKTGPNSEKKLKQIAANLTLNELPLLSSNNMQYCPLEVTRTSQTAEIRQKFNRFDLYLNTLFLFDI